MFSFRRNVGQSSPQQPRDNIQTQLSSQPSQSAATAPIPPVQQQAISTMQQGQIGLPPPAPMVQQHAPPQVQQAPQQIPVMNIQQPQNPVLQQNLQQSVLQHARDNGVTMDDIANLMITQGRASFRYRGPNASAEYQRRSQNN